MDVEPGTRTGHDRRRRPGRALWRGAVIALLFVFPHPRAIAGQSRPDSPPVDRVVPILFLPADLPFDAARLEMQIRAVSDAQAWYARRTGGFTFRSDPLIVQRSRHTFAELAGNDFQNWWPLPEKEFADYGMPWNDSSRVKLLLLAQGAGAWAGADSENGGIDRTEDPGRFPRGGLGGLAVIGDSSLAGVIAGVCPREGVASHEKPEGGTAWWCNWNTYRGTIAHELGHTFGLPHPDALRPGFRCDSTVITNMQCHWAWPADSLLPFEASHVRTLAVFSRTALEATMPAQPEMRAGAAGRVHAFDAGADSASILWLSGRGGGTGYPRGYLLDASRESPLETHWRTGWTDARIFVADIGLTAEARSPSKYRFRCGTDVHEDSVRQGQPPRRIEVRVTKGCVLESYSDGPLGIGNPRWSR